MQGGFRSSLLKQQKGERFSCWCEYAGKEKWNDPEKNHPTGGFLILESPKPVHSLIPY